jgi:transposase
VTDRQAALAVRCRIHWKYCLGLELTDPGFDHFVLSKFRNRMAHDDQADRLPAVMVQRLVEAGLVKQYCYVRGPDGIIIGLVEEIR